MRNPRGKQDGDETRLASLMRAVVDARSRLGRARERLRALLHQRPRTFDRPTSLWTLDPAAEVSFWRDAFLAAGEASLKTRPADMAATPRWAASKPRSGT